MIAGPILLSITAGFLIAWFVFMAAMAGRKNQLNKTFRAQTYYDLKLAEIARLKERRCGESQE